MALGRRRPLPRLNRRRLFDRGQVHLGSLGQRERVRQCFQRDGSLQTAEGLQELLRLLGPTAGPGGRYSVGGDGQLVGPHPDRPVRESDGQVPVGPVRMGGDGDGRHFPPPSATGSTPVSPRRGSVRDRLGRPNIPHLRLGQEDAWPSSRSTRRPPSPGEEEEAVSDAEGGGDVRPDIRRRGAQHVLECHRPTAAGQARVPPLVHRHDAERLGFGWGL
mmetsp:Transcript_47779/g.144484  ORF Transcript_47779/g.144484 Transcript_47779/m.144484 type:complete len:218 (-) Transcript_47779:2102-2755(-)